MARPMCSRCNQPLGCLVTLDREPKYPQNIVKWPGFPTEHLKHWGPCPPPPPGSHAPLHD